MRGMMSVSLIEWMSVDEQLQSLTTLVQPLQQVVCELRRDVGYWKSMPAQTVEGNTKLKAELDEAQAEIRQLKVSDTTTHAPHHRAASAVGTKSRGGNDRRRADANRAAVTTCLNHTFPTMCEVCIISIASDCSIRSVRASSPLPMSSYVSDSGTQTNAELALDAAPILPPLRRIFTAEAT